MILSRMLLVVAACLSLAACAQRLSASVENFSDGFAVSQNNVYAVYPIAARGGQPTLEERSYAALLMSELRRAGHRVTENTNDATHVIFFGISIGDPVRSTDIVATPVFGMVPSGVVTTTGTSFANSFSATTTQMQTLGVTGYVPTTVNTTTFRRTGIMVVFSTNTPESRRPVAEIRARSEGTCGVLSLVATPLTRAMVTRLAQPGAAMITEQFDSNC